MRQDRNMKREINRIDTANEAIRTSSYDQELGFVWGKVYIILIMINVLAALGSLVLNAVDPKEYASASDPVSKTYFVAISP